MEYTSIEPDGTVTENIKTGDIVWVVNQHDNIYKYIWHMYSKYGLWITLYNLIWLLRH